MTMTTPTPAQPHRLSLATFDSLSDAELAAQIDSCLRLATDPNCSPHFLAGVWMQASVFLNERTTRTTNAATARMLLLTKVMLALTVVVTIATIVGVAK